MILYFSATGNGKYTAERIASACGEKACSIEVTGRCIDIKEDEMLGIVTPTYFWELPIIVREYLEQMAVSGNCCPYTFVIATYGTTPGAAGTDALHILKKKGIKVSALYSVCMPDTWTPIFDLSSTEKVNARNKAADAEIEGVIRCIKERKPGNMMKRSVPYPARYISDILYKRMRKTKNFRVEENCTGCGLCESRCPANAISMKAGKPLWVKESCIMCLRCLHHCPQFAIQYGKNTKKHGQYRHPEADS